MWDAVLGQLLHLLLLLDPTLAAAGQLLHGTAVQHLLAAQSGRALALRSALTSWYVQ